jgi:ATP synthase protein I
LWEVQISAYMHQTRHLGCKLAPVKYTFGAFCRGLNALKNKLASNLTQEGRHLAKKILFYQSLIVIVFSLCFTVFYGKYSGISALYGGVICLVTGMVFAFLAFRYAGASQNQLVVRSFNKGSKLKFLFTIVMFVVVYKWPNLQPLPLMISYFVTLMAQWPIIIFLSRVDR